jgi:probable phosphoglycerate mutase
MSRRDAVTHYLYLVRHGEHLDAEHGLEDGPLSPRGRRQAELLADRLSGVPLDAVWHSPLERAAETARAVAERLPSVEPKPSALLFDCIPSGPGADMPRTTGSSGRSPRPTSKRGLLRWPTLWEFLVRKPDAHELLITHNFVIAWFVREVLDAPDWRWMTINQAHCGLTVLSQRPGRPWTLASHNDLAHLPVELRTGLPEALPV